MSILARGFEGGGWEKYRLWANCGSNLREAEGAGCTRTHLVPGVSSRLRLDIAGGLEGISIMIILDL